MNGVAPPAPALLSAVVGLKEKILAPDPGLEASGAVLAGVTVVAVNGLFATLKSNFSADDPAAPVDMLEEGAFKLDAVVVGVKKDFGASVGLVNENVDGCKDVAGAASGPNLDNKEGPETCPFCSGFWGSGTAEDFGKEKNEGAEVAGAGLDVEVTLKG